MVLSCGRTMTVTSDGKAKSEYAGSPLLPWTNYPWHVSQEAVLHTNAHMLEAFRSGSEAATSGVDNLKTLVLVEAAYFAAQTHSSVRPERCRSAKRKILGYQDTARNLFDLSGKTALVTGSSRGLGRGIAQGLVDAGAPVVLNGISEDGLTGTAGQFRNDGHDVLTKHLTLPTSWR